MKTYKDGKHHVLPCDYRFNLFESKVNWNKYWYEKYHLLQIGQSVSLVPFKACFLPRQSSSSITMHAWELILKFYEMKNGEQFNSTPARKLSQSFNLNIVGGNAISYKQVCITFLMF